MAASGWPPTARGSAITTARTRGPTTLPSTASSCRIFTAALLSLFTSGSMICRFGTASRLTPPLTSPWTLGSETVEAAGFGGLTVCGFYRRSKLRVLATSLKESVAHRTSRLRSAPGDGPVRSLVIVCQIILEYFFVGESVVQFRL